MEDFDDSELVVVQLPRSTSILDHFTALTDPRQVLSPLRKIMLLVL
jgi:hypothetical protein